MKKRIALLLCAAMLLSLAACAASPAEPTTVPTAPTEPSAQALYAQACEALDGLTDVTLELVITTLVSVDGDEYSEQSTQTLTYGARGTEEAVIVMEEALDFSVHSKDDDPTDDDSETMAYREIWYQGSVYAELDETYRFCGPVEAESVANRYAPATLLDGGLYAAITSEPAENGTLIRFNQPTAGESWAVPQESELVEASGSALLDADGKLTRMGYTVTYEYGPSLVTVTVQSEPQDTAKTVKAPANISTYTPVDCVDALSINYRSLCNLFQTDSLSYQTTETIFSAAGAVMWSYSYQTDMHGRKKDTIAKVETTGYFMDYSKNELEEYKREETYQNKKLTTVVNGGLPSSETLSWEEIRTYVVNVLMDGVLDYGDWENVTATDMGSLYYLEFQLSDNFGNGRQNYIADSLWDDPSFLIKLASKYENTELNAYYSVDKYTGLPVAFGYYFKGVHTIEGQDYEMWMQVDTSVEGPSKRAYKAITDELPSEEEPENKATPLFYHVTGKDGQEMWLFGTIHVGDERTAYLPQEIYDAFVASDALALECDSQAFDEQMEKDETLSDQVSDLYFYGNGKEGIKESMDEEDYAYAQKLLKAVGGNNMNMPYAKPYVWSQTIDLFYLRQGYQLHSDQGVEERLTDWAQELDKEILEIESSLFQIKMLTGFSNDLQILMLEESMETDGREYWERTWALYELWCAGDEEALRAEISEERDYSELTEEELEKYKLLMEEYDKAMSFDRNEGMLKTAIEYLESDKVIFYAVGLAHLLDDTNGLVDALREAGYTVELVEYAG